MASCIRAAFSLAAAGVAIALFPACAGAVSLKRVGTFEAPTYVTAPRGDHARLFVTEREGLIRVMKDGKLIKKPFLDLSGSTTTDGERGLLSMAFDPGYKKNRRFYTYSTDQAGDIRVDAFKRNSKSRLRANANSRKLLIRVAHPGQSNHNGGQIQFGPDGLLYAGTGDGGGAYDQPNNAQDRGSNLGKMLRINPSQPGAGPQQFAIGLRNPYRFSFDRLTGALVIGDVGQGDREEVDYGTLSQLQGANFGWKCREGTIATPDPGADGDLPCTPSGKVIDPIFDYTHSRGCSITGGYVVRDPRLPALEGRYLYGDLCDAPVRSINVPSGSDDRPTGLSVDSLVSFGEDAGGCVYTVSLDGPVSRIVPGPGGSKKPC
jgi:glucose/arabinose dehydrogenase